jgi:signal transduction histidine kinase
MTAGITHDFRNLLSVIDSALNLCERNLERPELVRKYINRAREGVGRGLQLTNQLLELAAHHVVAARPEDANELIADLAPLLKIAAGPQTRIHCTLRSHIPKCLVDRSQFDAAMLNLVANARDAMPNGGDVQISTDRMTEGDDARGYVSISVHDTGHGMTPDTMRRILVPFFTTKGVHGTGLGLPQVSAFVTSAQGRMAVTSSPGAGTSITLMLPSC